MSQRISIKCDECNYEFLLSAAEIKQAGVVINDQQFDLIYFVCPKCNKIYRISINDARYYELKDDLDKIQKRIQNNIGRMDEDFARTLNNMRLIKFNRLKEYSMRLNNKFSGTFTFMASENNQEEQIIKYLP